MYCVLKICTEFYFADLNPIELLWDLKVFVRSKFCKTIEQVRAAIGEYYSLLTPEKYEKLM